jgi:hypothetical protein
MTGLLQQQDRRAGLLRLLAQEQLKLLKLQVLQLQAV